MRTLYQNIDPKRNIGKTTGREFAVYFENGSGFFMYKDGTTRLAKEDFGNDLMIMEKGVRLGVLKRLSEDEFLWQEK